jgi:hypothetical protein
VELKSFFFNTIYIWTAVFVATSVLSFHDLFFFLLLVRCFSCIFPVYLGYAFYF